jgi:hypothetical protein
MKKLVIVAVAALVASAIPAFAGGGCCGGKGAMSANGGFDCANECPLAQAANTHRSAGRESMAVSTAIRATLAASVQKNLARV